MARACARSPCTGHCHFLAQQWCGDQSPPEATPGGEGPEHKEGPRGSRGRRGGLAGLGSGGPNSWAWCRAARALGFRPGLHLSPLPHGRDHATGRFWNLHAPGPGHVSFPPLPPCRRGCEALRGQDRQRVRGAPQPVSAFSPPFPRRGVLEGRVNGRRGAGGIVGWLRGPPGMAQNRDTVWARHHCCSPHLGPQARGAGAFPGAAAPPCVSLP